MYFASLARHHQLQIHNQKQTNADDNRNRIRSTKSAKNTFIYYVVMPLCYTPMFIGVSVSVSVNDFSKAWTLAETVAFMNSSINPFFILLAPTTASNSSYKNSKANVM